MLYMVSFYSIFIITQTNLSVSMIFFIKAIFQLITIYEKWCQNSNKLDALLKQTQKNETWNTQYSGQRSTMLDFCVLNPFSLGEVLFGPWCFRLIRQTCTWFVCFESFFLQGKYFLVRDASEKSDIHVLDLCVLNLFFFRGSTFWFVMLQRNRTSRRHMLSTRHLIFTRLERDYLCMGQDNPQRRGLFTSWTIL